mmetsp:Transcript_18875/g.36392  ORF Transcript_18875/g.36392 Transcript_18875/m.36392 type:complete len:379 (-) Transcript_18875:239-1375(-)
MGRDTALEQKAARLEKKRVRELAAAAEQNVTDPSLKKIKKAKKSKNAKKDVSKHEQQQSSQDPAAEPSGGDDDEAPEEAASTRKPQAKSKREKSQKMDVSVNEDAKVGSSAEAAKSPQAGNGNAKSQKKRKLDKSGDSPPGDPASAGTETAVVTGNKGSNKKQKKAHGAYKYTCFFGQLPYDTTKEELEAELKRAGVEKAMVRLLTDKVTKKFRGIAFVDMLTEADRKKALKLHHTKLNGRQINVERVTFQPGRASDNGKDDAKDGKSGGEHNHKAGKDRPRYSKKLEKDQVEELVRNEVAASRGVLKREDFDDKNMSFLGLLDRDVVEEALKVASKKAKNTKVRNRQAYLMGVILRIANKAREGHSKSTTPANGEDV